MAYKIEWTENFGDDLAELVENYKKYRSAKKAKEAVDLVFDKTELLKENPAMGRPSPVEGVRSIPLNPDYRMYYIVSGDVIQMLNLFYMRANPENNPFE